MYNVLLDGCSDGLWLQADIDRVPIEGVPPSRRLDHPALIVVVLGSRDDAGCHQSCPGKRGHRAAIKILVGYDWRH